MNNMAVFEKVASGEITSQQAAAAMLEADRQARAAKRPAAVPVWAWILGSAIVACLLGLIGIERQS